MATAPWDVAPEGEVSTPAQPQQSVAPWDQPAAAAAPQASTAVAPWDAPSSAAPWDQPQMQQAFDQLPPATKMERAWGKDFTQRFGLASLLGLGGNVKTYDALSDAVKAGLRVGTSVLKVPGSIAELWHQYDTGEQVQAPLAGAVRKFENSVLDIVPKEHWWEQIPEGLGSAAGFLATGALGGLPAIAGVGAANQGQAQYEEAVAAGADPDQAAISLIAGSALGASEALPMAFFMNRLNKISGGRFMQRIREIGLDKVDRNILGEVAKSFLIEGGQEGLQQIGSNWIAKDLAGYDPSRTLGENFWDNVFTGGAVGSLLGGGLGLINRQHTREAQAQLQGIFDQLKQSPINEIEGSFTPVHDLMLLNKFRIDLDDRIRQGGVAATQAKEAEFGELATTGIDAAGNPITIPASPGEKMRAVPAQVLEPALSDPLDFNYPTRQGPSTYLGAEHQGTGHPYWETLKAEPVDPKVEKGLPTGMTVEEALKTQPVVVPRVSMYDGAIDQMRSYIARVKGEIKNYKPNTATHQQAVTDLKAYEERLKALKEKQRITVALFKEIKNYAGAVRSALGYKTPLMLISTSEPGSRERAGTSSGWTSAIHSVPGIGNVDVIWIQAERLAEEIYKAQSVGHTQETARLHRRIFETISHEIGHNLFTRTFQNLYETAQKGGEEGQRAYETYNWLEQEYRKWLKDAATMNRAQAGIVTKFPGQKGAEVLPLFSANYTMQNMRGLNYFTSIDEFFADLTARLATQKALPESSVTKYFKPVLQSFRDVFDTFPEFAKNDYGNNWLTWLKSMTLDAKIEKLREAAVAGGGKDIFDALRGKVPGFDPKMFAGRQDYLDKWNKLMESGFNLLQMQKENPHIKEWGFYINAVEQWQNYQRQMSVRVLDALNAWKALGKGEASQLSNVLLEEQESKARLPGAELGKRLSAEALEVYHKLRGVFDYILDEMQTFALTDVDKTFEPGSVLHQAERDKVVKEFQQMKDKGYFPAIRFGEYTITAYAKEDMVYQGQEYKEGQLITFPVFESEKERNRALEVLRKELGSRATVSPGKMAESDFAIQGMPRSMLRALRDKLKLQNNLTPEMEQAIEKALADTAPFRNFRKQFLKKKGIHGASEDMMRSFAYYGRSAAGHIARVKYSDEMLAAVKGMEQDVKLIQRYGGLSQNRQEMVHWLKRHFDYIMNPAQELAALRGVGFVAYLGFMVKSAFVNATQTVMTTYPYLAARHGDAAAVAALGKAMRDLKGWVADKKSYLDALQASDKAWAENPALLKELGPTKVVDAEGTPLRVFHGTTDSFAEFSTEYLGEGHGASDWGPGLYFTDKPDVASSYTGGEGGNIHPVYLSIKNPATNETMKRPEIQDLLGEDMQPELVQDALRALGHDGIIIKHPDGTEYIVFDSSQVVSAFKYPPTRTDLANNPKARIGRMIAQGLNEGWLDQSLATELAIAASENNLDRGLHLPKGQRLWHEFSRYSAMPFHVVEKMNRYIAAMAAYELGYKETGNHDKATQMAKQAVRTTQFENSRWNRPQILRGKKSVALLFANFVQNALFFAAKDPGARRWWMMMLLMAGLMGLPGAEDAEDLVDFAATGLNRQLGLSNPKFQLRVELRKALEELHANPDLIMHGISQNSFGLGHVGELAGLPIPQFDLSGSMGMGNVLPGTKIPAALLQQDPNQAAVQGAAEIAGASGNLVEQFYSGLFSSDPDGWKRAEKIIPMMALRNISKAARYLTRGEEATAAGDTVAEFNPHDLRDQLEIAGQALGFTPSKLSLGWERTIAQKDAIQYYTLQATALQRQLNWAFFSEDREAFADVREKIKEYNSQVPFPELKMGPKQITQSLREYLESKQKAGAGVAAQKKYHRLRKSVEEVYPDPYGDSVRKDEFAEP